MRKTAILLALACAFARADYGPGTTDSDFLRSGTPVVTNAWLAVSNETARLVENHVPEVDASRITDGTNTIDAAGNVFGDVVASVATNYYNSALGMLGLTTWQESDGQVLGASWENKNAILFWMAGSWNCITNGVDMESVVGTPYDVYIEIGSLIFMRRLETNTLQRIVGRLALTNDIPHAVDADLTPATNWANQVGARVASDATNYTDSVSAILVRESTNAATAVADAKISTNNAAFVSAVLAVPLAGADAGDLAEISEYGGYGTIGAAILSLIAGLAALKRRVTSAETALAQKASLTDLPYRLVEPGEWEFSKPQGLTNFAVTDIDYNSPNWTLYYTSSETSSDYTIVEGSSTDLSITFGVGPLQNIPITATRASLPGHLHDRAGNRVVVTGDTTLTLPAANPGYLRDFLVRLEISGSTVPTITFAAPTGETITYETDGDEFPVPDEAGDWLYSFTESCVAHKFAVSLKKVNEVAQGGA